MPDRKKPGPKPRQPEHFWSRTEPEGECVVWTGARDKLGYGRLGWDGKIYLAHRLAFYLRMGRWPETDLRHLCNNPPCVLHVVEGTRSENSYDAVRAGTHNEARKTHCKRGHPFDDVNTKRLPDGRRMCRRCANDMNNALRRRKRREAKAA